MVILLLTLAALPDVAVLDMESGPEVSADLVKSLNEKLVVGLADSKRDIDGDELQIIDFDLNATQLLGQAPIQVVNADSADPKLQVRQVLPGTGHRISATFSDGLSEPQTVHIDLILRSLSGAVDCWTD